MGFPEVVSREIKMKHSVAIQHLSNDPKLAKVIVELTKIKGIGNWTAEMVLIFYLQRPDVFSLGDLGLRSAVAKLYKVNRDDI